MNFCDICQSVLTKEILSNGQIRFICSCLYEKAGDAADTLIAEVFLQVVEASQQEVFIENSPHDPAGNIIMKDCPQCGLDYMTLIRVGKLENVIYTCICGAIIPYTEYTKNKK